MDADSEKTKRVHFNLLKAATRKNVLDDIGQNAPAKDTNRESLEEEVPFIDKVPILPAVANAAVFANTQNAVTAETAVPNQPAANLLASQPQPTNNSAMPDAPIQSWLRRLHQYLSSMPTILQLSRHCLQMTH